MSIPRWTTDRSVDRLGPVTFNDVETKPSFEAKREFKMSDYCCQTILSRDSGNSNLIGFGLFDETKKDGRREIGVLVSTWKVTTAEVVDDFPGSRTDGLRCLEWAKVGQNLRLATPAGEYYCAQVMATRNGRTYGSAAAEDFFRTEAERDAWIQTKVAASRKRYQRLQARNRVQAVADEPSDCDPDRPESSVPGGYCDPV
jgi:hypothetical protein